MENNYYKSLIEKQKNILLHIKDNRIVYQHIGLKLVGIFNENYKIDSDINQIFRDEFYSVLNVKLCSKNPTEKFDFKILQQNEVKWFQIQINKINSNFEFLLIFEDITKRKNEEENFRLIFENAVMGIYKSTPGGGRHLSANPELARIYGYENTEDLLDGITDISNQLYVDKDRREELLNSLSKDDSKFGFESQLYRKDGKLIWISENAKAVKDSDGKVKFIVGTVKDITERKIAEEKIRQAKEDWERTFDSIDNIVIILDKDLNIRRMNKAAQKNVISENFNDTSKRCSELFNCDEGNCIQCPARKTVEDLKAHTKEIENLYQGKTFQTTASPIFDDQNELQGIVFVAKDITEEKKLRQQAEYRLQQVIQTDKLKSLGEVVAGVAHEINNPNAYITTNVSLLEETWKDIRPLLNQFIENNPNLPHSIEYYNELIEETPEIINSIKDGSQRIKNVVGNLKDFARINTPGSKSGININEVVNKGMTIIGANIRRLVKTIKLDLANDIPEIKGHFQKLEQVLINLVLNSSQAILDKSEGRIEVQTKYIKRLDCITIQVKDNGFGIPDNLQSKLFDPFFTTRRDIGGSGLGLSISYEIIQEHNGKIAIHSKEGVGSKFTLFLPVNKEPLELSPKILCVDDEFNVPNMLKIAFLEETGKFFSFITEAAQITNFLSDHPEIDIIMMNDKFGKFSLELIKKVKDLDPLIEIIFYSDRKEINNESKVISDHYMNPFNIEELRNILNSVVRQRL